MLPSSLKDPNSSWFLNFFLFCTSPARLTSASPCLFSSDAEACCCVAQRSGCWRGTLLWKQQWWSLCDEGGRQAAGGERSPPGTKRGTESSPRLFSCPCYRLSNKPSLLFTPSPAVSGFSFVLPALSLFFYSSPSLPLSKSIASCLFPPRSLLSVSFFLSPHKDTHSLVALKGEQNVL